MSKSIQKMEDLAAEAVSVEMDVIQDFDNHAVFKNFLLVQMLLKEITTHIKLEEVKLL